MFSIFIVFILQNGVQGNNRDVPIKDLIQKEYYFDKSMLIEKFFQTNELISVAAPRGFGKTTNLQLLKAYLEIQVNRFGEKWSFFDINCTSREIEDSETFSRLKIYNSETFAKTYKRYPVIYTDFQFVYGRNYSEFTQRLSNAMKKAFLDHEYLFKSARLSSVQKSKLKEYFKDADLNRNEILFGLNFLSELLYMNFNEFVVVLIDNVDEPILKLLFSDFEADDILRAMAFLRFVISNTVKNNPFVRRSLINARTKWTADMVVPLVVNIYESLESKFHEFYGITFDEVVKGFSLHELHRILKQFSSYNTSTTTVFCTESLIRYIQKDIRSWVETETLFDLRKILEIQAIRDKFQQVVRDRKLLIKQIDLNINLLVQLQRVLIGQTWTYQFVDVFMTLLLRLGYFKLGQPTLNGTILEFPNLEIYNSVKKVLYNCTSVFEQGISEEKLKCI